MLFLLDKTGRSAVVTWAAILCVKLNPLYQLIRRIFLLCEVSSSQARKKLGAGVGHGLSKRAEREYTISPPRTPRGETATAQCRIGFQPVSGSTGRSLPGRMALFWSINVGNTYGEERISDGSFRGPERQAGSLSYIAPGRLAVGARTPRSPKGRELW